MDTDTRPHTSEAWKVSEEEAERHVYPHDECVTKELAACPDYPHDLNLCAEFEKTLKDDFKTQDFERARYIGHLENLASRPVTDWSWALATATARSRCIAFLKVKGVLPNDCSPLLRPSP
jgi:hypothetical protein